MSPGIRSVRCGPICPTRLAPAACPRFENPHSLTTERMMSTASETLQAHFDALHAERERNWPAEQLARHIDKRKKLTAAFDRPRAVKPGDQIEPIVVENSQG